MDNLNFQCQNLRYLSRYVSSHSNFISEQGYVSGKFVREMFLNMASPLDYDNVNVEAHIVPYFIKITQIRMFTSNSVGFLFIFGNKNYDYFMIHLV